MLNTIKMLGLCAILSITPRGCLTSTAQGAKYVSQNVPVDVFTRLSEKVESTSPEVKNKIWEALARNLKTDRETGANVKITINDTLRRFNMNYP